MSGLIFSAAIASVFLAIGLAAGYAWEYKQYADVKAVLESERAQAQANADSARAHAEKVGADVSAAWSNAYEHLRNRGSVVRVLRTNCDSTGLRAGTAALPDGITAPAPVDTAIRLTVEQCEQALNDGIKDAAQLLYLQRWVQEVGK